MKRVCAHTYSIHNTHVVVTVVVSEKCRQMAQKYSYFYDGRKLFALLIPGFDTLAVDFYNKIKL